MLYLLTPWSRVLLEKLVSSPICAVPFETTRSVLLQANCIVIILLSYLNLLMLNGYVMHQPELYFLPTLYLCVLY
jgi:hypothetical protein